MSRIHCDHCGTETDRHSAIEVEFDREVYWFCTEKCRQTASHLYPDQHAGPDERGGGPQTAPDYGPESEPEPLGS